MYVNTHTCAHTATWYTASCFLFRVYVINTYIMP